MRKLGLLLVFFTGTAFAEGGLKLSNLEVYHDFLERSRVCQVGSEFFPCPAPEYVDVELVYAKSSALGQGYRILFNDGRVPMQVPVLRTESNGSVVYSNQGLELRADISSGEVKLLYQGDEFASGKASEFEKF